MKPVVEVANHQQLVGAGDGLIDRLEIAGTQAAEQVLAQYMAEPEAPLAGLEIVEVALVDDETIARVHVDFMDIPGATDVITFDYGEIVIGMEVAQGQAVEHGEPTDREVFRYLVHGLLHLAGHEDESAQDRKVMEKAQEALVKALW